MIQEIKQTFEGRIYDGSPVRNGQDRFDGTEKRNAIVVKKRYEYVKFTSLGVTHL